MSNASLTAIMQRFNDAINAADIDTLAALMTDDHVLNVDMDDEVVRGRDACLNAWRTFFDQYPDYRNVFTYITEADDTVTVIGHSTCSEMRLHGPALWRAVVMGDRIALWQVCDETPANRAAFGIP